MAVTPSQADPALRRPIVVIGAGGIVKAAHLPAYRQAGYEVAGLYDLAAGQAHALAEAFGVSRVYGSLAEAARMAPEGAVFDVAVPAPALETVLPALPDGAAVLVQKPLGENLAQARALRELCHRKRLKAAVNFQLRFAPNIAAARRLIEEGAIGEVHDLEVRVTVYTPWQLWTFLERTPRVEILYHSIHYVDLIRSFLGEPSGVHARTVRHPLAPKLAATRTTLSLDYGDWKRATVTANHGHAYGPQHQESYVKWEGTKGALVAKLGVNLNYPAGEADTLEICRGSAAEAPAWSPLPVEGNWFPHAFAGSMASVMRFAGGSAAELPTAVDDACRTMAVVEAAYASSASGATPVPPA